jgi:hypothetical protein
MKEGYEDIKRAIGTFIEAQVTSMSGKVSATFPEDFREVPCAVIDVISSRSNPLGEGGLQTGLARITIVDSNSRTLDQLFDDIHIAFIKYGYTITDFQYRGVFATTPMMKAFLEKDEALKREMDIDIAWIIKR